MECAYFSINKLIDLVKENKPFEQNVEPSCAALWFEIIKHSSTSSSRLFLNRSQSL